MLFVLVGLGVASLPCHNLHVIIKYSNKCVFFLIFTDLGLSCEHCLVEVLFVQCNAYPGVQNMMRYLLDSVLSSYVVARLALVWNVSKVNVISFV